MKTIALLTCCFLSTQIIAQDIIFHDDFNDNISGWSLLENEERSLTINNGKLIISDDEAPGSTQSSLSIFFDSDEDFEIELQLKQTAGAENQGTGLVFGRLDAQNYYSFTIAASKYFRLQKSVNGTLENLIPWTSAPNVVNPIGQNNKLLLRKTGANIKLYVNDKFVGTKPFEPFFGQNIGIAAEGHTVEYEYLTVRSGNTTTSTATQVNQTVTQQSSFKISDVDQSVPSSKTINKDAIAVVIGNTAYLKTKKVDFALNDAKSVKNYLIKTMGFKEGNILYVENATKGDFELLFGTRESHQGKLANTIKRGLSDVFVFYSGHGAPGLKDQKGYFVPVECDPNYVELTGYSSEVFYQNLTKIGAKSVTVVLDACFSGATIFENISPILIKEKPETISEDILVLGSSSGSEVSSWYNDQNHGMFTYFFLKAILEYQVVDTNSDKKLTLNEVYKYVVDNNEGVPYWARRINGIEQHPTLSGANKEWVVMEY